MPDPRRADVHRVPMRHPGDTTAIEALFDTGALDPASIVAILGKTEGNGCVNHFTRAYAVQALSLMLARRLGTKPEAIQARIALVMSGGTEGGLSPHFLVLTVAEGGAAGAVANPAGALAIGIAFTPDFAPEEIGRMVQVEATATAVRHAMAEAGITDPAEVHYVQVKCPLLSSDCIGAARARGATVATEDTYASMGLSRGASALGVALALGEVSRVEAGDIGHDWTKFSGRASASAGIELSRNEVIVLGNSRAWAGDLRIAHAVMRDTIDLPAVRRALDAAGVAVEQGQVTASAATGLVAVLAKA